MLSLPTCLLKHQTTAGSHYDWLLMPPGTQHDRQARLWTARVEHPSSAWPSLRHFTLERIAPHRRAYLTFQGPLTHSRGTVTRIDQGWHIPLLWTPSRMVLDLHTDHLRQRVELRQLDGDRYIAALVADQRAI